MVEEVFIELLQSHAVFGVNISTARELPRRT